MPNIEIIAGPCAVQSVKQMQDVVAWAKDNGVSVVRACLRKPRTHPGGFVGLGVKEGLPIIQQTFAGTNLTHATEVITPQDVHEIALMLTETPDLKELNWIGAKTGPSNVIGAIAEAIFAEMPTSTELMVKNQMEANEDAWIGRIEWAQSALDGRVSACHRGFEPSSEVAKTQRNQEDLAMAWRVKERTKTHLTLDPSHIAGRSPENVVRVTRNIIRTHNEHFDQTGELLVNRFLVEVSPDPDGAQSDRVQQLPLSLASSLIAEIRRTINMGETV